jgi:hypothetical protein
MFSLQQIEEEGRTGFAWKWGFGVGGGWGRGAQTMYTHISKCKNDKRRKKKKV